MRLRYTAQKQAGGAEVRLTNVLSRPTLYRFRSVFLKLEFSDEGTSLSKSSLLEVTSGTLVAAVRETSASFTSEWASPVLEMS